MTEEENNIKIEPSKLEKPETVRQVFLRTFLWGTLPFLVLFLGGVLLSQFRLEALLGLGFWLLFIWLFSVPAFAIANAWGQSRIYNKQGKYSFILPYIIIAFVWPYIIAYPAAFLAMMIVQSHWDYIAGGAIFIMALPISIVNTIVAFLFSLIFYKKRKIFPRLFAVAFFILLLILLIIFYYLSQKPISVAIETKIQFFVFNIISIIVIPIFFLIIYYIINALIFKIRAIKKNRKLVVIGLILIAIAFGIMGYFRLQAVLGF